MEIWTRKIAEGGVTRWEGGFGSCERRKEIGERALCALGTRVAQRADSDREATDPDFGDASVWNVLLTGLLRRLGLVTGWSLNNEESVSFHRVNLDIERATLGTKSSVEGR